MGTFVVDWLRILRARVVMAFIGGKGEEETYNGFCVLGFVK